jgi:RNA polymerase sigma-70 factor (ECF subfamily)
LQDNTKFSAPADTTDFAALIALVAKQRDRAAFLKLYEHFAPRVKSFLLGKNVSPELAEEVLQEVMIAVWQKSGLYKPEKAAVSTWIFTIARNKHIDRIRQEKFPDLDAEDPSLQPAENIPTEDDFLAQQRSGAVKEALACLPKDQYDVIFMSFMQGLPHAEISVQLGLPLGTVKSRIRLGFERLRQELVDLS